MPKISPYAMCNEALRLIELHNSGEMTYEEEKQIILLLNRSECYPNMSAYQLSLARNKLAEYYMAQGITGSALAQYQIALSENPQLPVKKLVKSLLNIPARDLIYSIDANIAGAPDYSHIISSAPKLPSDPLAEYEADRKHAEFHGMTVEEYRKWNKELIVNAHKDLQQEAAEEDAIYDPKFDEYVESQLDLLGDDCRKSFYDFVRRRELETADKPDILSYKKWAESILQSFWQFKNAADYHKKQLAKAANLSIDNSMIDTNIATSLSPAEMRFLQYMHHKNVTLENLPGYWTHEYHLNYLEVLTKLISLNYLGYANLEYSLNKLKVPELKEILNKLGLDVNGKKKDLVMKIMFFGETDIVRPYRKMYYEVTETGKNFLSEQEYEGKDLSFKY